MIIRGPEELSFYVRNQRKAQKRSQSTIGDSVGLKQSTISEFENKSNASRIETLFRILSATDLEIHLLPKGEEMMKEYDKWDKEW